MSASPTNELVVVDKRHAMTTSQAEPSTVEASIYAAAQRGDIALVEKLMDLKDRHDRTEARKAFVEAMSEFKAEAIHVAKDKVNNQYGSKYVSLGNLVATVTPFLSKHGLSVRWNIDQKTFHPSIMVECIVTHTMGHSESVPFVCPPDKSGSKNPIQEIKSAITYAKACTFESITGLASTDANLEDDGNKAGGKVGNGGTLDNLSEHIEWIQNARNDQELDRLFKAAYAAASKVKDTQAQKALVAAKDKQRRELER